MTDTKPCGCNQYKSCGRDHAAEQAATGAENSLASLQEASRPRQQSFSEAIAGLASEWDEKMVVRNLNDYAEMLVEDTPENEPVLLVVTQLDDEPDSVRGVLVNAAGDQVGVGWLGSARVPELRHREFEPDDSMQTQVESAVQHHATDPSGYSLDHAVFDAKKVENHDWEAAERRYADEVLNIALTRNDDIIDYRIVSKSGIDEMVEINLDHGGFEVNGEAVVDMTPEEREMVVEEMSDYQISEREFQQFASELDNAMESVLRKTRG